MGHEERRPSNQHRVGRRLRLRDPTRRHLRQRPAAGAADPDPPTRREPAQFRALAIDEEARQIGERLRLADERDAYELITCLAVRPMDLLQYLNQHRPQIVHFSGHGDRAGQIVLAAGDGREQRKPSTRRSRRWPCTASPSGTSPSSWRDRTPTPL